MNLVSNESPLFTAAELCAVLAYYRATDAQQVARIAELEALLRQKEEDCDELKVALDHERLPKCEREYCARCGQPRPLDCPHCGDRYPFV
jgi:hypothetical protein